MKKLLLLPILLSTFILTACGDSDAEREAKQKENEEVLDEKVNEIMQKLEDSSTKAENEEQPTDTIEVDSI